MIILINLDTHQQFYISWKPEQAYDSLHFGITAQNGFWGLDEDKISSNFVIENNQILE